MSFKGNSFSFIVREPQKLLYMFLTDKANAIEFYNKFDYAVDSNTTLEELDKNFEVEENAEGELGYYAMEPFISFSIRNKLTNKKEDFKLFNFHTKDHLPFYDECNSEDWVSYKFSIEVGDRH